MPWCPKCKSEFREGFTECESCGVALVDELPEERPEDSPRALPEGMSKPIVIHTAANRLEAEMLCDMLREHDIVVLDRAAAFRQIQAYSGADARFGVEIVVDASQVTKARLLIEELHNGLGESALSEEELAQLAEEQAELVPEQPPQDNAAFRLLPVLLGVIAVALLLLWMIAGR